MNLDVAKYIPWIPALAAVLCGICCTKKSLRWLAAPICILSIFAGFVIAVSVYKEVTTPISELVEHTVHQTAAEAHSLETTGRVVHFFDWIHIGGFEVNFSYFFDSLTMVMLFVITGIGTLVAWYGAGYMKGDRGYARFFMGVSLFIFAMTNLVMADNLVLLYLGWEGVGLCSYLLIGYYYDKPSAVAAAKKAFIVNRIGDLGFAAGIFLTYQTFGTVSLHEVVAHARAIDPSTASTAMLWIPFLLMLGAFGKSAQLPLYVWLPDAMEGPTPVSALIHAATMVTAGVYMISRLLPVFVLSAYALPTVACVGAATAIFAATIALCQYDIKRIYAYSTVSQLGYMFLGVGALSTVGGVFHLFTHAFFKALLFLTAGSVMHALAGQLDLRKMSGLRKKMPVTCWLMFIGCLALAGFPFTSGFYSKDMILGAAMERGLNGEPLFLVLAIVGLVTAFLTAYYTFRLWFRVFMGPEKYEMGHEQHAVEDPHGGASSADHPHDAEEQAAHEPGHAPAHIAVEHHHDAHEMPFFAMNLPLILLALGALFAGIYCEYSGFMEHMIQHSTASTLWLHAGHAVEPTTIDHYEYTPPFGLSLETCMQILSGIISILGISLAAYFHWFNRPAADAVAARNKSIVRLLENKYYVDEIYNAAIVQPLHLLGEICFAFDRLVIDGLVTLVGFGPKALGLSIQPSQRGKLQGYGVGMAFGVAAVVLTIVWATR